MGQKATNTIEQIKLLKARGMILDFEEKKIKEFLLDIGYYRLGFYWTPFEIDKSHNFKKGTKFSDIIKLYYLDVDLRNILAKYINRIEINFRTKLVYYVSNKYKDSPTWFADQAIVNNSIIDNLSKFYNGKFIKLNKPIKKHHDKYINDKYAPAWKTLEFFTFGTILNIYRNLKDDNIKTRISESFGIKNIKKFINLIETIILIRNSCAHGDVLFDFNTPKGISVLPQIDLNNDRNSMYSCIKVIYYFLGTISDNRKVEMDNRITEIFESFDDNENIKGIIKNSIKYC
ncbi:Abi family protein [Polaribacter atrinae]|uniref:Abi family protein n=1 Tax=Polaribacter atrinae TaxID=1333662 RepID=UPI0030FBAB4D